MNKEKKLKIEKKLSKVSLSDSMLYVIDFFKHVDTCFSAPNTVYSSLPV
jgi:hypothetical protein